MFAYPSASVDSRQSDRPNARCGFTILELLVVFGVVSLLIALVLAAIQKTREVSRRIACSNNLHQISIATETYHSTHQALPCLSYNPSVWPALLPYFETSSAVSTRLEANLVLPVLNCPSETGRINQGVNYAANIGARIRGKMDGPFGGTTPGSRRLSEITDGTSHTALFSERIKGTNDPLIWGAIDRSVPRALIFNLVPGSPNPDDFPALAAQCESLDPRVAYVFSTRKGLSWLSGFGDWQCTYDHVLHPNSLACANDNSNSAGMNTASSFHSSGINVLFADGAVKFISDHIDLRIWKATGTRAGGEVIADF